jgi:hypothetical protein
LIKKLKRQIFEDAENIVYFQERNGRTVYHHILIKYICICMSETVVVHHVATKRWIY